MGIRVNVEMVLKCPDRVQHQHTELAWYAYSIRLYLMVQQYVPLQLNRGCLSSIVTTDTFRKTPSGLYILQYPFLLSYNSGDLLLFYTFAMAPL